MGDGLFRGRLAIIDTIPNDQRTGPPLPLLFAVNMLVNTDEGGTYTLTEYRKWLAGAGFARVEAVDIGSHSPTIVVTKAWPASGWFDSVGRFSATDGGGRLTVSTRRRPWLRYWRGGADTLVRAPLLACRRPTPLLGDAVARLLLPRRATA